MRNAVDVQKQEDSPENQKKKGASSAAKIVAAIVIIIFLCGVSSIIGSLFALDRFIDGLFNPSEETIKSRRELQVEYWEEVKATVTSNFRFDIPITESSFLPDSGEVLLLSASVNGKSDIHYIPLDHPTVFEWVEQESETDGDNDLIAQHIPTWFNTQILLFEDGSYLLEKGSGATGRVDFAKNGAVKAEGVSSGGIDISSGADYKEVEARIDQFEVKAIAWSEDEELLYFVDSQPATALVDGYEMTGNQHSIYSVKSDGSDVTKIYEFPAAHFYKHVPEIVTIPKREEILVNVDEELIMLNPVTGEVKATLTGKGKSHILVSPDGTKVAYKSRLSSIEAMRIQFDDAPTFESIGRISGSAKAGEKANFIWTRDSQSIIFKYNNLDEGCYREGTGPLICFYKIAIANFATNELTYPLGNYAFEGQIVSIVSR